MVCDHSNLQDNGCQALSCGLANNVVQGLKILRSSSKSYSSS